MNYPVFPNGSLSGTRKSHFNKTTKEGKEMGAPVRRPANLSGLCGQTLFLACQRRTIADISSREQVKQLRSKVVQEQVNTTKSINTS